MTTYGTIPTSAPPGPYSNLEFISRVKDHIQWGLAQRRPWKHMISPPAISLPSSAAEAGGRIRQNIAYFRANYAIVVLFALFVSLLWRPVSLIVFTATMSAWLFLYFLRDDPVVVLSFTVDDRVILIGLLVVTVGLLLLTHATMDIVVGLVSGAAAVLIHGVMRRTDDLGDEEEEGGVGSVVASRRVLMKEAASSSFSYSSSSSP
ncbi:PRA1 family protein F2-like [Diospyros lotus]|uniref:PRA1 family protein F2-like n=1 Tax=Diospyros lotus TaxID=55363 RepID=UPI00225A67DE|nr:PRA1 family protein F2-like [Diospyros lotus]